MTTVHDHSDEMQRILLGVTVLAVIVFDAHSRVQGCVVAVNSDAREWIATRRGLRGGIVTPELSASLCPGDTIAGPLLVKEDWLLKEPIDTRGLQVEFAAINSEQKLASPARGVLAHETSRRTYARYSEALGALDRPSLFEDRLCYRVMNVSLSGNQPSIALELMTYFDAIDLGEAMRHELAVAKGSLAKAPLRKSLGDLREIRSRHTLGAVNVITLRAEGAAMTFLLHERDGSAVATEGGDVHVTPCGVFQPASPSLGAAAADADIWKSAVREYAEEFLGFPEAGVAGSASVDYESSPPFDEFWAAQRDGTFRLFLMGAGVNPTTGVMEFLCAGVFEAATFDRLFELQVHRNEEGLILAAKSSGGHLLGFLLDDGMVNTLPRRHRLAPAGRACLALAFKHKAFLQASVA
jgi:hypothetical protein